MRAPDLTEKVLGFRTFVVADGGLCSTGIGPFRWSPGPNRARCFAVGLDRPTTHSAPVSDCRCGFRCLHAPPSRWQGTGASAPPWRPVPAARPSARHDLRVAAAVLAWGRLKIHRDGFRAEYAEIALIGHDPLVAPRLVDEIQEVALVGYGVQAASLDEGFEARAMALGRPVPERLLPR